MLTLTLLHIKVLGIKAKTVGNIRERLSDTVVDPDGAGYARLWD